MCGLVDSIRRFVVEEYILPAIREGRRIVRIRAGDVHKAKGLTGRVPAVITALGSKKFIEFTNSLLRGRGYCIKFVGKEGPGQSTTTTFTYEIVPIEECGIEEALGLKEKPDVTDEVKSSMRISRGPSVVDEDVARRVISEFLDVPLYKERVNIFGKFKEFDLVNVAQRIVGDIKGFTYGGVAAAEFSNIVEYVWLMEKLEQYTGVKWRKIIVGYGRCEIFERFKRRYDPWLGDLEIYFIDEKLKVHRIR